MQLRVKTKRRAVRALLPVIDGWRDAGATWEEVRRELEAKQQILFASAAAMREAVYAARRQDAKRNAAAKRSGNGRATTMPRAEPGATTAGTREKNVFGRARVGKEVKYEQW